ncbi:MAG: hypothetical protein ACD_61C00065G0001, partial [uncultured bacterium]
MINLMFGFPRSLQEQMPTVSPRSYPATKTISDHIRTNQDNTIKPVHLHPKISFWTKIRPISYLLPLIFFTYSFHTSVYADTLSSPSFQIDMSTINMTGGNKTSASYRLSDTVGQTVQGQFDSAGYVIKAGFQYIHSLTPFTFTVSNLDLNYGSLVPGTPSLLTNILTVTTGSAYGYTVKTLEDHPLRVTNGSTTIADTSCDLASPCTQTDATPWT